MEIRAALPPSPDKVGATGPPLPEARPRPPPMAAIALAIIDGILLGEDGARERVTLRLLPTLPGRPDGTGALLGRVVGSSAALRLETVLGTIVPRTPFAAVLGSTIRLELLARALLPPEPPAAASAAAPAPPVAAPTGPPPDSAAIVAALPDPAAIVAALPDEIQAGDPLAASLLLLLAAVPALRLRLRPAIARRQDGAGEPAAIFAAARRVGEDEAHRRWRTMPLPWPPAGTAAHLLRRERRAGPDEATSDDAVRFMIEVSLRHFGEVQLDGLYRRRRFDLVLRSHAPLALAIRDEAGRRFHAALAAHGLGGGLAFTVTSRFPVSAAPETRPLGIDV